MYIYGLALKEVEKKIDIIRYDYEYFNKYDSIDHVMTDIKSPESILNKLKKDEMEPTYKNLVSDINDVARCWQAERSRIGLTLAIRN